MRTPLDLPDEPPASGRPYWYWLAGTPSLDLVNTLRERWNRNVECLVTTDDLAGWLTESGLVDGPVDVRDDDLVRARELRESIDRLVVAAVEGHGGTIESLRVVEAALLRVPLVRRLDPGGPGLRYEPVPGTRPVDTALAALAEDAARIFTGPLAARVRVCAGECSARFLDRSPAAERRWCSMRLCGNTAKARRHRARGHPTGQR